MYDLRICLEMRGKIKTSKQFIEDAISCHMEVCKKAGDSMPLLYMEKEGERCMLPLNELQDMVDCRSPMDLLKPIIEMSAPDVYCMCAEAWMSKVKTTGQKGKDLAKKYMSGEIRPSNDPNKVEIFIVVSGTKDGKTRSIKQWDVIRDNEHKIIDFKKNTMDFDKFESNKIP